MLINLIYDASVASAPAEFKPAMVAAADAIDALISNPIVVNIQVGWGEDRGVPLTANSGQGGPNEQSVTYSQLRGYLTASAGSAADQTAVANIPVSDPTNGGRFFLTRAQAKAFGALPAAGGEIDGAVGFAISRPWNFDPTNTPISGETALVGVAEHELTHALARYAGTAATGYTALNLFRYASPGLFELTGVPAAYFSIDGGRTNLDGFSAVGDSSDWDGASGPDAFNFAVQQGFFNGITPVDVTELDVLGFTVGTAVFSGKDTTNGQSVADTSHDYKGPVPGLKTEFINTTTDSLNITVTTPNWFVHTGAGTDAIAVLGGTNVLDGGTGSNFLTGGTGSDTFFVDDRGASGDIWSSVVGFHAGDSATVWGVTAAGFGIAWVDGQGATGFTGLTLHATAAGKAPASLTLTGYTQADMTSGRISVQFGTDAGSGSAYMFIHGNS